MFLSDEGPTLETLDFTSIHIGSTPTFLYFICICIVHHCVHVTS